MTIPDIIDNSEHQLFDVLNELLESRKPADFAGQFDSAVKAEEESETETRSYVPEDLELVCYMTLS